MLHEPIREEAALCIRNLSVSVEGRGVVQDASLSVPRGEIHGLLGPNGAGKTTLLRTLYRASRPASGQIAAFGRDMYSYSHAEWAHLLGALVQSAGLLAGLTPRDIVEIGLEAQECPDAPQECDQQRYDDADQIVVGQGSAKRFDQTGGLRIEDAGCCTGSHGPRFVKDRLALEPEGRKLRRCGAGEHGLADQTGRDRAP